jgi:hypothetical protein
MKKEDIPEEEDKSKPKNPKPIYNLRDVIKQIYSNRVQNENPYKPNDKAFVGNYQKAVTTVIEKLTEEELQEAEELVETWNEQGPPAEFQLK